MNRLSSLVGLGLLLLPMAGCDDAADGAGGASSSTSGKGSTTVTSTTGTASASGSTSASTSTGGPDPVGGCITNDDCPGGACLTFNGMKVCQYPVEEATTCSSPGLDECCNTAECPMFTKCVGSPIKPHCGGAPPPVYNVCAGDECATNNDCAGGICVPPGIVENKVAICVASTCAQTTCTSNPSLPCGFVKDPCCSGVTGFHCVDGCTSNADCMDGYCELDPVTMVSRCTSGTPICPP